MAKRLAYIISRILGPLTLVCLIWLVTAFKSGIGFWKAVWVYPLIFILSIAIPFGITTYLILTKRVDNLDWKKLEDRNRYFPIALGALGILVILTYFLTNSTIFHLTLVLAVIILATIFCYLFLRFKISAHMVLASITFAAINLFYHLQFLWLYLLLIPLAWARYTLKVHTLIELVAGLILANGIILAALLIFGWPNVP
jgi:hypothetical protein